MEYSCFWTSSICHIWEILNYCINTYNKMLLKLIDLMCTVYALLSKSSLYKDIPVQLKNALISSYSWCATKLNSGQQIIFIFFCLKHIGIVFEILLLIDTQTAANIWKICCLFLLLWNIKCSPIYSVWCSSWSDPWGWDHPYCKNFSRCHRKKHNHDAHRRLWWWIALPEWEN